MRLQLTIGYEDDAPELAEIRDIDVDPRFLSEPWEEAVMFGAAGDDFIWPDPDELDIIFADRAMGVVIYADSLIGQFVTVSVREFK